MSDNGHRMNGNGHNPTPDGGASEGEMRASELDIEVAPFATRLREAYVRSPAPAVAEAHVEAMLAEADSIAATGAIETPRDVRPQVSPTRWVAARRLALVPAAVLVLGGGLAVAGVRPPEPISDVFESVGIDVPGSDTESSDGSDGRQGGEQGGRHEAGGASAGSEAAGNDANDGSTPGAEHANPNASEGQETAEQARSGQTPPDGPGRSDDHPAPQGNGTPPEDPGHPGQGKPDSPPGQGHSSAAEHGGGTANQPDKSDKDKPEK